LNEAQKRAVDTIEGPVMVVAGPGTGKTQVMALRVANILRRTQMKPANILCLTFSVSAATAMRERLRHLIGADAYGVRVSTIHAFAQSIIAEHAMAFEEWSASEQISDLEKIREMNTIIDQYSSQMELINPKDPCAKMMDILGRISQMKREGKTPDDVDRVSSTYDDAMAAKSKPGTKVHEKNLASARKFKNLATLYRAYQDMLARTGRYDYDDMILHVIRALETEDWLLAGLQERFQYVLIDEAQDTNGAQWKLIDTLTTAPDVPHDPNLFIVGDDDQAIYRFQGANIENMLAFHRRFPKAPVVVLTTSYRSTQPILDAARSLIERNSERLVGSIEGLEKRLTAAKKSTDAALPRLLRTPSDTAEPWIIADLVEARIKEGTHPEEIAILTQTNSELFPLAEVLRARGIPTILHGKDDLLAHPIVGQALAILRAVAHPRNDAFLSGALGCDCFALHPADIGRICARGRELSKRLVDVLVELPSDTELPLTNRTNLLRVRDILLDLHYKTASRTVLETVEHMLRSCALIPMLEEGAKSDLDPRDPAALDAFFSFVRGRALERRSLTLDALLADLDLYADPLYAQVRLTYELPHLTTNGVRLMTAHQSKGLEFETVILTNLRDGHWDKRRRPVGVSVPEDLLFGWSTEQKHTEQNQDERRVAFVAMTRAKRELLMTCPREITVGEKIRAIAPSGFFAEMGTLPEDDIALVDPTAASLLLLPRATVMDGALEGYLTERLKTFALSPTALNRFLRNPQEFLLVDLLQQPEHFDEGAIRSFGYGSAVHWGLRQWAVSLREGKSFDEKALLDAFSWYLAERTILTENQRRDLLAMGAQALPRYFADRLAIDRPVLHAIERDYRANLGDVPIKGKIDRIDLLSASSAVATVIDYKTGRAKSEREIRGGLEEGSVSRTEDGGNFRQLVFYSLLLEHADPLLKPETFALEFIGERGEEPERRNFTVSDSEKKDLRSLIDAVWSKITALDFSPL
jgi:DNA helicase-2/ATP-dependent DNA helicase PcrA